MQAQKQMQVRLTVFYTAFSFFDRCFNHCGISTLQLAV